MMICDWRNNTWSGRDQRYIFLSWFQNNDMPKSPSTSCSVFVNYHHHHVHVWSVEWTKMSLVFEVHGTSVDGRGREIKRTAQLARYHQPCLKAVESYHLLPVAWTTCRPGLDVCKHWLWCYSWFWMFGQNLVCVALRFVISRMLQCAFNKQSALWQRHNRRIKGDSSWYLWIVMTRRQSDWTRCGCILLLVPDITKRFKPSWQFVGI